VATVWSTVELAAEPLILITLKDVVSQCLQVVDQQDHGYGPQAVPDSVLLNKIRYARATHTAQLPAVAAASDILLEIGKEIGTVLACVLKISAVLGIHSVEHATLHQQVVVAELSFNVALVMNFGQVTAIASTEHGRWVMAVGVAETMTKVVANGYTGGVPTISHAWADLIILKWDQIQNAIRGTTFMKWPAQVVQDKDFTLFVTFLMKVTCGTWVTDIVLTTVSTPATAQAQAE
jgi:hypothetical protein